MTGAHKTEDCEVLLRALKKMIMINDQTFEVVAPSAPRTGDDVNMRARRLVSSPDDELQQHQLAGAADTIAPRVSEEYEDGVKRGNIEFEYHIDPKILGTGHHGSVRRCIHRSSRRRCAVKSIRKAEPSVKLAGIEREIELLREMNHHNIVQLIDVFEDSEYVHIVTTLHEGGELFDRIVQMSSNDDNGAPCFEEARAARILLQILTAVSHMHEKRLVHRDLKPENILFQNADEDSIKIIDFGLSRKHEDHEPMMKTIVGTPYYIAPEVLRRRYDRACDMWSLGVIAYILLSGYPPFQGTSSEETHRAVLRGRYSFPAQEWHSISREAMDFVVRLLQMDPSIRMTAEEALDHPWIVKYSGVDEMMDAMSEDESLDGVSVDVAVNDSTRPCMGHAMVRGNT